MSTNTKKWEEFVNDFIFANYENIEYWIAKRNVSENGMIFNYIQFPKDVNGKQLSKGFIEYMVQEFEADNSVCKKIFGPEYEKETAEIQDDAFDISIVWNINYYEDVCDDEILWTNLYDWKM